MSAASYGSVEESPGCMLADVAVLTEPRSSFARNSEFHVQRVPSNKTCNCNAGRMPVVQMQNKYTYSVYDVLRT